MCHVSDPCASSSQPLDQTVIRWMIEMEWSCASLHAVVPIGVLLSEKLRFVHCYWKAWIPSAKRLYDTIGLYTLLCLYSSVV